MFKKSTIFVLLLSAAFLLSSCIPAAYKRGVELSRDYPGKDLPIYDDAVVFECEADDEEAQIAYGVIDGDVDDVMDFYQDYFQDEGITLTKEKEDKDEYSARGSYKDFEFKISVEEAKGKYEEKVFETVVEVEIEYISKEKNEDKNQAEEEEPGEEGKETEDTAILAADPSQTVDIPDKELEKLLREELGISEGDITVSDMELLDGLSIKYDEYPICDLTGLEYAVNMYHISYYGGTEHSGSIKSLAPLSKLPLMEYISVSYSAVEEAPPVFETPVMDRASFIGLNLSDFSFLAGCTGMTQLTVDDCGITSIEFVRDMPELESFNANRNSIKDIAPIEGKTKLASIDLQDNQITDISALATCTSLESVVISYNYITTLSPLHGLANLTEVRAYEEIGKKKIDQGSIDTLVAAGVEVYYHE